jgi:transposase
MDKKGVTLTVKEQKRLKVLVDLEAGRVTGREATDVLGVSLRHVWRLLAAFREEGAAGLAHGNRGREPVNKVPQAVRERIVALAEERYADYNDAHFTEKLEQQHQIKVSRATLRRLRRGLGKGAHAGGARHAIANGVNGTVSVGCCCSWMGARMTGWKGMGHA